MARLCFGEFDWPDRQGKRELAQILFLNTLEKIDQAPLQDLYGTPFRLYREGENKFHLDYASFRHPWRLPGVACSLVELLEAEIEAWAVKWNLNAAWCTRTALSTLHTWSCSPREIKRLFFRHPGGGGSVPTSPDPPEGFPRYAPYESTRDHYLERLRSNALNAIMNTPPLNQASRVKARGFADSIAAKAISYCRKVEAVYEECGWRRCRKNEKKNLNQHSG